MGQKPIKAVLIDTLDLIDLLDDKGIELLWDYENKSESDISDLEAESHLLIEKIQTNLDLLSSQVNFGSKFDISSNWHTKSLTEIHYINTDALQKLIIEMRLYLKRLKAIAIARGKLKEEAFNPDSIFTFNVDSSDIKIGEVVCYITPDTDEYTICAEMALVQVGQAKSWGDLYEVIVGSSVEKPPQKAWTRVYGAMRRINDKLKAQSLPRLFNWEHMSILRNY